MHSFSEYCSLSLICADPLALRDDITYLKSLGLKKIHIDIMDALFVPRFGIYPEITKLLEHELNLEFDAHFMVSNVISAVKKWRTYHNPSKISFHYSGNENETADIINFIRSGNSQAIMAFDLSVPDKVLINALDHHKPDGIMLLAIMPGILEQKHRPDLVVRRLKLLSTDLHTNLKTIQVDGGVNFETIKDLVDAGATELVCGSSSIYKGINHSNILEKKSLLMGNVSNFDRLLRC